MSSIIADILGTHFHEYATGRSLPPHHYKVANAIMTCRTEALGGHIYRCDECGHTVITYNSCRNRHCPQCQAMARAKWVQHRIDELLPVQYFHMVFTIPRELNPYALRFPETVYSILFRAASGTLRELAANPKHLGGQIGFIAVLHTWGQTLIDHPHLHCIVPGGVLSPDGTTWKHCRRKFLLPVAVVRKLFRGKFLAMLREAVAKGEISPADPKAFGAAVRTAYSTKWHVYCKPPFAGPDRVVKYLGQYTHRVGISDRRIVSADENAVRFRYKDYRREKNMWRTMSLSPVEFLRRFLLHVLPDGFMKIRYYGFLANRARKDKLEQCRTALNVNPSPKETTMDDNHWHSLIEKLTGHDPLVCPSCKTGKLRVWKEIAPLYKPVRRAA